MGAIVLGNRFRRRLAIVSGAAVALLAGTPAIAQEVQPTLEPPAPEGARLVPAEPPPAPDAAAPAEVPPPAVTPRPGQPSAEVQALLDAQQRQIDELEARLDDVEAPDDEVAE